MNYRNERMARGFRSLDALQCKRECALARRKPAHDLAHPTLANLRDLLAVKPCNHRGNATVSHHFTSFPQVAA